MFDSLDPTTDQTPLTKAMMTAEIILNLLEPLGPSGPSGPSGTSGVGTTGPSPQAGPLGESSPRSGAPKGAIAAGGPITSNYLFGRVWKIVSKQEFDLVLMVLIDAGLIAKFTIECGGKTKIFFLAAARASGAARPFGGPASRTGFPEGTDGARGAGK